MTQMLTLGIYVIAAFIPAYLMVRNTRNVWRNLLAWLTGFAVECIAVIAVFLFFTSTNNDAAPLAVVMALTPPLPMLLIAPSAGLAVGNLERFVRWRFSRKSN